MVQGAQFSAQRRPNRVGYRGWVEVGRSKREGIYVCIQLIHFVVQYKLKQHYKASISSVQSLSRVRLFVTPWPAAHQASLSIIQFWSLLRLMSIKSVMPSDHLILCHPLFLLPLAFPSIRVFSNE